MSSSLTFLDKLKRRRRRLAYYLFRPKPFVHPVPISGPAIIVGSAPVAHLPDGYNAKMTVITVNGSQAVLDRWEIGAPDATLMQYNQVEGKNDNAVHIRRVLNGRATGVVWVMRWKYSRSRLLKGLAAFDYRADRVEIVSRNRRMALYNSVMGENNFEDDNESKFSNGITAVLYALASGATDIIITGINPASTGHAYNQLNLQRLHAGTDTAVLRKLVDNGFQIYTADPDVADQIGLPLWKTPAKSSDRDNR